MRHNTALSPASEAVNAEFWRLAEGHFLLRIVLLTGRHSWRVTLAAAAVLLLVLFTTAALVCHLEDTLTLPDGGRGLYQHYGTLANILGCPLILLLSLLLLSRMVKALNKYTNTSADHADPERLSSALRQRILEVLSFDSALSRALYYLMVCIGFLGLLANIQRTRMATAVYGQDVWDSSLHAVGFVFGKILLAFEWMVVMPIASYYVIAAVLATILLSKGYAENNSWAIRPLDADGCGGFRLLGQVILVTVYIIAVLGLVLLAHFVTHRNVYDTLSIALVLIVISASVIFVPFWQLHSVLADAKRTLLEKLADDMWTHQEALSCLPSNAKQPSLYRGVLAPSLLFLAQERIYIQAARLHTWPYISADRWKWLTPLLPAALSIVLSGRLQ